MPDRSLGSSARVAPAALAAVVVMIATGCASGAATAKTSPTRVAPQRAANSRGAPAARSTRDSAATRRALVATAAPAGMDVLADRDSTSVTIDVSNDYAFITGAADGRPGVFMLDTGSPDLLLINRHVVPLDSAHRAGQVMTPFGKMVEAYSHTKIPVVLRAVVYPNVGQVRSANLAAIDETVRPDFLGLLGYPLIKDVAFKIDYSRRRLTLYQLQPAGVPKVAPFAPGDALGTFHFTAPDSTRPQVVVRVGETQLPADFDTGNPGALVLTAGTRNALEAAGALHVTKDSVTLEHAAADSLSLTIPLASVATGTANHLTIGTRFFAQHPTVWNFRARTLTVLRSVAGK